MKNKLFISLIFLCGYKLGFAQNQTKLIDKLFESRTEHFMAIPDKFKNYYKPSISMYNKLVIDTLKFFISNTSHATEFFLMQSIPDGYNTLVKYSFWSKYDTIVYHWDIEDKSLRKIKIDRNKKNRFSDNIFYKDVEEWNEYVTNRSYFSTPIAGGSFLYCSRMIVEDDTTKIDHASLREYNKDEPIYYLRERLDDDYKSRLQVNCDWITDDKKEEIMWFFIGYYKERGAKIFDCEGNEIEFEYEDTSER